MKPTTEMSDKIAAMALMGIRDMATILHCVNCPNVRHGWDKPTRKDNVISVPVPSCDKAIDVKLSKWLQTDTQLSCADIDEIMDGNIISAVAECARTLSNEIEHHILGHPIGYDVGDPQLIPFTDEFSTRPIQQAWQRLNSSNASHSDRHCLLTPDAEDAFLDNPYLKFFAEPGVDKNDNMLGVCPLSLFRAFGMNFWMSQNTKHSIAFHRDAYTFVCSPLHEDEKTLNQTDVMSQMVDMTSGLALRVSMKERDDGLDCVFDTLFGSVMSQPDFVCRVGR